MWLCNHVINLGVYVRVDGCRNHIMNLGHGIEATTPEAKVLLPSCLAQRVFVLSLPLCPLCDVGASTREVQGLTRGSLGRQTSLSRLCRRTSIEHWRAAGAASGRRTHAPRRHMCCQCAMTMASLSPSLTHTIAMPAADAQPRLQRRRETSG